MDRDDPPHPSASPNCTKALRSVLGINCFTNSLCFLTFSLL